MPGPLHYDLPWIEGFRDPSAGGPILREQPLLAVFSESGRGRTAATTTTIVIHEEILIVVTGSSHDRLLLLLPMTFCNPSVQTVPYIVVVVVISTGARLGRGAPALVPAYLMLRRRETPLAQRQRHHAHVRTARGYVETHGHWRDHAVVLLGVAVSRSQTHI